MKKASFVLALSLVAVMLTGCGKTESGGSGANMSHSSSANSKAEVSKISSSTTFIVPNESSAISSGVADDTPSGNDTGEFNKSGTISETVLYDSDGVKITAKGLTYGKRSAELEVSIENKTSIELSFYAGSAGYGCNSINNYMISDGYLSAEAAPGESVTGTIKFDYDALMLYGINEIAEMQIGFSISQSDYKDDVFKKVNTEPAVIKTSFADNHDYSKESYTNAMKNGDIAAMYDMTVETCMEDKIYDNDGIRILSETVVINEDGEKILFLEAENTSSETVVLKPSDISLNGLRVFEGAFSNEVVIPGKRTILSLEYDEIFDSAYYDTCGMSDITVIDFTLGKLKTDYSTEISSGEVCVKLGDTESEFNFDGKEVYNANGIKIVSKGVFGGHYDSDDSFYWLLIAQNTSDKDIYVDDVSDTLNINGEASDYYLTRPLIKSGGASKLEVEIDGDAIGDLSDIKNIEITLEIEDTDRNDIGQPTVNVDL